MILENGYHVALKSAKESSMTFDYEEMIVINVILPDSQLNFSSIKVIFLVKCVLVTTNI